MNCTLKGRLMFTGDGYDQSMDIGHIGKAYEPRPWPVVQDDDTEIDLRALVMATFQKMHGQPATQKEGPDFYEFVVDQNSKFRVQHQMKDGLNLVSLVSPTGVSFVNAHIKSTLAWLAGRIIEATVTDQAISIRADDSKDVFHVECRQNSGDCPLSDVTAENICRVGRPDRCIFNHGESGSYQCDKFSGVIAEQLLDAHAEGRLKPRWTRIGSCALVFHHKAVT